jgi:hypothetical protein
MRAANAASATSGGISTLRKVLEGTEAHLEVPAQEVAVFQQLQDHMRDPQVTLYSPLADRHVKCLLR